MYSAIQSVHAMSYIYASVANRMAVLMTLVFYTSGTCGLQINLLCYVLAHVDQYVRNYLTIVMATKVFSLLILMMLRLCLLRWRHYSGVYRLEIWHNHTTAIKAGTLLVMNNNSIQCWPPPAVHCSFTVRCSFVAMKYVHYSSSLTSSVSLNSHSHAKMP